MAGRARVGNVWLVDLLLFVGGLVALYHGISGFVEGRVTDLDDNWYYRYDDPAGFWLTEAFLLSIGCGLTGWIGWERIKAVVRRL